MRKRILQRIVRALRKSKAPLSIAELAHSAKITRITASNYVMELEDAGVVKVTPRPPLKLVELRTKEGLE